MKTVHKFPVALDTFAVLMPVAAHILCVRVQGDVPFMWAELETREPAVPRWFHTAMTGAQLPERVSYYVGTFELPNGIVGHLNTLPGDPRSPTP